MQIANDEGVIFEQVSELRLNRWRNWDVNFKEAAMVLRIFLTTYMYIINQLNDQALVQSLYRMEPAELLCPAQYYVYMKQMLKCAPASGTDLFSLFRQQDIW